MGRGRHVRRIPTRTKRRRISGLTASVALAAVAVIGIGALAVNSNGFEIDAGESVFPLADAYYSGTDGADDWAEGDSQDGVFLGVPTGSTPPLGAGALVAPDCYGSDIYTNASIDGAQTFICDGHSSNKFSEAENNIVSPAGKTPEDIWPIKAGNNSPKNEFSHAYAMFRLGDSICDADTDEDDLFLYLGGNRSNAEGEAFWGFELNQTPPNGFDQLVANGGDPFALNYNRTLDDLLISFTVEPGQNLLEVFEVTNVGVEGGTATFSPAVAGCFQGAPDGDSELQINVGDEVNDSRNGLDGAVLAPDWNIPVGDPTPKVIDGGDGGGNTFRLANGDNRGGDGHFLVAEKEFIEAAVDLQAFNIESQCFSSLIFTSRSSHPLESADLKDVAGGYANLCDASIQIAPDDVNEVGDDHTFIVTANQVVAGVAGPAPDGTIVSVTLTDSEGAVNAISTNTCAAPGTVGGTCTITFSSDSPGTVTGHASTTLNVLGDSLFVETDGVGSNSGDAMKHFVDASVTIAADDVNVVGNSHTFTVTVTPDAPTGVTVTSVSITPTGDTGDITAETCSTKTATALTCDITVNSTATGSASIGADVTVVFDDDSSTNTATVNVSTDGITPNSGPAVKHWVDASVTIAADDVNVVGNSHTFTVTVTPDAPTGVTVTSVSITPTGDTGDITAETCSTKTATALTCDITVNSTATGSASIGADVTVVFDDDSSTNTATVNVSTDGITPNSGPAVKHWVDASVTIAADDVNVVGNSHTFTVTVTPDAPTGVTVTSVSITPTGDTGDITAETCSTKTATALTCDITVNSTATGSASIGADVTVVFDDDSSTNTATVNVSTDGITPNSGPAVKHWVDASVTIAADDVNVVGNSHTFTVTVTPDAPTGVTVTSVSITPTGDTGDITAETCSTKTATALTCDITVNSTATGSASIGADVTVVFDDDSSTNTATVNVSTDGITPNSGPAVKHWVDASVTIAADDVNVVGNSHTFTVTVTPDAPTGVTVTSVSITPTGDTGDITAETCSTKTATALTCDITVNSTATGSASIGADVTVVFDDDSSTNTATVNVSTDGITPNSGPAVKHWVDASVTIAADDVNVVGNSHTFTVTVTPDAPTGVTVTSVSITPTGDTGDITAETCSTKTATALTCDITVNSTATGSASIGADVTVVFDDDSSTNTATVNVSTDGITPNSGPAVKHWVDASVTIGVDDTNNLNESHTFTATVTPSYPAGVTITSVSITPTGDTGLITAENCDEAGAGSALTCDITVNSGVAATATIGVDVAVVFDDDSSTNTATVNVSTDGTGSNSGAATKTWVDGSLVWHKVDELGNPLAGATFEVCQTHVLNTATNTYDDITDVCFSVTDNTAPDADPADGEFLIDDVILGRYTVRETAAPAGYIIILNTAVAFPDQTLIAPDVEIVTPFVNTPPLEGCTPGWWWNNGFAAWDEPTDPVAQAVAAAVAATWGGELDYVAVDGTMNSLFKDVFSLTDGEMAALGLPLNWTLWDAINANGGQFNALQRHGVSALLNSVSVAFEFSAGQVLVDMNVALADGIWNDQALLNSYSNANERNHDNCPQGGDTALTSASLPWGAGLFSLLMLPIAVKRGRHRRQRRLGRG